MRTKEEVKTLQKELDTKIEYLRDFLATCYKGSDVREKVDRELAAFIRERNLITWILKDNDLPF